MFKTFAAALALCVPAAAFSASVTPMSYTYLVAPNHGSAYLDDTYNGTLGELTDGISATSNWEATDGNGATGPNVGWQSVNPLIQFRFDQVYDFAGLLMNFQDGQGRFGVIIPDSIIVTGAPFDSVTSPMLTGGTARVPLNTVMDLRALAPTDVLTVEVVRGKDVWTFLSEFTFNVETSPAPVPLPAGLPLLFAGLMSLGMLRRARTA